MLLTDQDGLTHRKRTAEETERLESVTRVGLESATRVGLESAVNEIIFPIGALELAVYCNLFAAAHPKFVFLPFSKYIPGPNGGHSVKYLDIPQVENGNGPSVYVQLVQYRLRWGVVVIVPRQSRFFLYQPGGCCLHGIDNTSHRVTMAMVSTYISPDHTTTSLTSERCSQRSLPT